MHIFINLGDSRDDDDGGHLERSESYHGNIKARPPTNRNRNQPPYRQRENSQSQVVHSNINEMMHQIYVIFHE